MKMNLLALKKNGRKKVKSIYLNGLGVLKLVVVMDKSSWTQERVREIQVKGMHIIQE